MTGTVELARAAPHRAAGQMISLLRELGEMSVERREQHIELAVAAGFDCQRIEARRAQLSLVGAPLLLACNVLFGFLVAVVPLALWLAGIARAWMPLLAILIGLQCWASILFARAHRRLFGDDTFDRRSSLFQLALSPPLAVHAHDALSRDVFAEFHPVAVASVLTPNIPFLDLARAELRECRFGARRRHLLEAGATARAWFDERVFEQTAQLVARAGTPPEALVSAPAAEAGALVYCPMCHTQFGVAEGRCEDCDGVPLIAFAAADR